MEMIKIFTDGTLEQIPIGKTDDTLQLLQDNIGGFIDAASGDAGADTIPTLWVHDEGALNGMPPNFPASFLLHMLSTGHRQAGTILYGNAVFAGTLKSDGSTIGVPEDVIVTIYKMWRQEREQ